MFALIYILKSLNLWEQQWVYLVIVTICPNSNITINSWGNHLGQHLNNDTSTALATIHKKDFTNLHTIIWLRWGSSVAVESLNLQNWEKFPRPQETSTHLKPLTCNEKGRRKERINNTANNFGMNLTSFLCVNLYMLRNGILFITKWKKKLHQEE